MNDTDELKMAAAKSALEYIEDDIVIGVGSGSTVNFFIDFLPEIKHRIDGTVASSIETETRLKAHGIPVLDLNAANEVPLYIDGADEYTDNLSLTKGGGGALTREKIIATVARKFICIVDESKHCRYLGEFPIAVEVIPMARSYVAREIVKMNANPVYREGFVTDNGNHIIDVHDLKINEPSRTEEKLNNITGVVCNGIFAKRPADLLLCASRDGIHKISLN